MSAQVAADLRAAADVLERDGWTQDDYEKPDGCKCVVGAIEAICGSDANPRRTSAYMALYRSLGTGPINWNDEDGRTADEVIAALRAAADQAEAQQ